MRRNAGEGGWVNKAAHIMAIIFNGSFDAANDYSAECLVANDTAQELVSRTSRACNAMHMCWKRLYADRGCRPI